MSKRNRASVVWLRMQPGGGTLGYHNMRGISGLAGPQPIHRNVKITTRASENVVQR
jgi:hypothetical protein